MKTLKAIFLTILISLLAISCGTTRYYQDTYNNVTVLDDGSGQRAYYPHVYVKSYEVTGTTATVSFVDINGHLYVVCGKTILVSTVVNQRNDVYYYDYRRPHHQYYSTPRPTYYFHYRYTTPRGNGHHRNTPRYSGGRHGGPPSGHHHSGGGRR